jgi:hypothetical protein
MHNGLKRNPAKCSITKPGLKHKGTDLDIDSFHVDLIPTFAWIRCRPYDGAELPEFGTDLMENAMQAY